MAGATSLADTGCGQYLIPGFWGQGGVIPSGIAACKPGFHSRQGQDHFT